MKRQYPSKILITSGRQVGGVTSFAEALRIGFTELGIPVELVAPSRILHRWRELRDPRILKILSTWGVFASPYARRALCMAHGFPCAATQGWPKALALLGHVWLATASKGAQVVEVSEYSALHLNLIFGLRVDAVIHNPIHPLFLEPWPQTEVKREAITYVGRLHCSKNVDRLLPAMRDVLDENPGLLAWIVGDGPLRPKLEAIADGDQRIQFLGELTADQVRERLRRTRVFVSGNPTEPFGIVFLEALSQGCALSMPASGGSMEIAPGLIGNRIQLLPTSMDRQGIVSALRKALIAPPKATDLTRYSARVVAEAYLEVDARFSKEGMFRAEAAQ